MDKWDTLVRMLVNTIPHWANCFLAVGMALERYILICKATDAERLLCRRNRLIFYSLLIFMIVGTSTAYVVDFVLLNPKKVSSLTLHSLAHSEPVAKS